MIKTLLIANRGEIACRIIATARRLGIAAVAVYSDADANARHVRHADRAVHIGPAAARESYLDASKILDAARHSGADAIHPGYGFLSENAAFAEACEAAGIIFVGPTASAIRAMGLKDEAKALMQEADVPVVPGYHGSRQEPEFLRSKAYEIGYPVLIKAVAGGGGKGMRRVDKQIAFDEALEAARREASGAFGDDRVLIEKFVASPRHIELQVFGDSHGNAVHLFERDCTVQRRHQKVVEEAPAPGMTDGLRARMGEAAVAAAKAVNYRGAGTVEFIVDGSQPLSDESPFYFMEMNTRLQVEHPVTECITGLDLVEWQLRVADGEPLPAAQEDLIIDGHAVEVRLYAEDPETGFLPSTGHLHALEFGSGEGVRIDAGVSEGDDVSPFYDPMIAKIIAHGDNRDAALDRLANAMAETIVAGPKTNLGLLQRIVDDETFRAASFDTSYLDLWSEDDFQLSSEGAEIAAAAGLIALLGAEADKADRSRAGSGHDARTPWDDLDGFVLGEPVPTSYRVDVNGESRTLRAAWNGGQPQVLSDNATDAEADVSVTVIQDGESRAFVQVDGFQREVVFTRRDIAQADGGASDLVARAPMHGRIVSILVGEGDAVEVGQTLAVVEAMKMEHAIKARIHGTVAKVSGAPGDQVSQGAPLVEIEALESAEAVSP
ncbi:acetyl-CoA carboxylase biotin carboxylase subunit [Tepidamorphus sp. 3E244]|uniref:acetyl-CoA carboxylase biotin carboxylase subunit n=1 Tax=Tepidamorphus sp. 3E244 TaxID=3385498 RepID=UPI0038FD1D48